MKKLFTYLFVAALASAGTTLKAQDVQVDLSDAEAMTPEIEALAKQTIEMNLSDPDEANKVFSKLLRKVKKSNPQCVAAGKFFIDQKIYPCAKTLAQQAYTLNGTDVTTLKLNAAVSLMRKDYGTAGAKVDEILLQDPNNVEALRLGARIYKYVNPIVSEEYLDKILALDANNWNAYKEYGDIEYSLDEYKKACDKYEVYFKNTPAAELSILSAEQYCYSLIATNQWETLSNVADVCEPLKTDDIVFKRARFYSDIETFKLSNTENSVKYITEKMYGDSTYIYRDYAYAAKYAENNDSLADAIDYYKKGLEIDDKQFPAYQQIANLYRRLKDTGNALTYYKKYIEMKGDKAELTDQRGLLQTYIAAKNNASTIEEKRAFAEQGDAIAELITTEKPDSYQGPYYRAQLWILDNSEGEEKPYEYYTKALELLGDNADYDSFIVQAATYCAFYNLKNNNDAQCIEFCNKVLKFDADNATAKQFLDILK